MVNYSYVITEGFQKNKVLASKVIEKYLASHNISSADTEMLKQAIDTLRNSLANLAFTDERPVMPWDSSEDVPSAGGDISDYVQDGLAFHLDGINKGGVADQWTDLIDGVDFPNHGAVALKNGWEFNGMAAWMGYSDPSKSLDFYGENCTLEVCFEDTLLNQGAGSNNAGMFLCAFGVQTDTGSNATNPIYMNTVHNANGTKYINGVYAGRTENVWMDNLIDTVANNTVSINRSRALHNGIGLESLNATHWASSAGGRTIGAQNHGRHGIMQFATGKIYSIRIYDRLLTAEEIIQNQKVDNVRFNLNIVFPQIITPHGQDDTTGR